MAGGVLFHCAKNIGDICVARLVVIEDRKGRSDEAEVTDEVSGTRTLYNGFGGVILCPCGWHSRWGFRRWRGILFRHRTDVTDFLSGEQLTPTNRSVSSGMADYGYTHSSILRPTQVETVATNSASTSNEDKIHIYHPGSWTDKSTEETRLVAWQNPKRVLVFHKYMVFTYSHEADSRV